MEDSPLCAWLMAWRDSCQFWSLAVWPRSDLPEGNLMLVQEKKKKKQASEIIVLFYNEQDLPKF